MMRRIAVALASLLAVAACTSPATPPPAAPRPRPVPPRVTVTRTRLKDGSVVTVAAFSGPVTYVLHDGSEDPGLAAGRVRAGPAVRGTERRRLLAAFNGGGKLFPGGRGSERGGAGAGTLRPTGRSP